jgi:hypothetical protein
MIFKAHLDCYTIADPLHGIEYRVSNLRRERSGELVGELSVSSGLIGANDVDGVLSEGSFNFSSVPARAMRAKILGQAARTNGKINFLQQLEEVCKHTTAAERRGRPGVLLRTVPPAVPDDLYVLEGWKFPKRHLTILFGPGGTLKSYLLLWALGTLAGSGVRVGFVDWELDAADHSLRESLLFGAHRPAVHYLRAERPLIYELPRIQQWKRENDLDYLGLDSIAYGTAAKPEDSENAMAYNRAFRALDCGGMAIAHIRKDAQSPAEAEKFPFGSIFWHNSARCTWFAKAAEDTAIEERTKTIGLFNRKMNLSAKLPAIGFAVDFEADRTSIARVDVADVADLAASLPLWQRIRDLVRYGPQTLAEIASELGHKNVDSLDRIVRRQKSVFTKITGRDGIQRIALVDRRAS